MKHLLFALALIFFGLFNSAHAQSIEKLWQLEQSEPQIEDSTQTANTTFETLKFENGEFKASGENTTTATGDYMLQNNLLVFYYSTPTDDIEHYKISELTDSTLVFNKNANTYSFKTSIAVSPSAIATSEKDAIIPSQGFSTNSLLRGLLGMIVLLVICYLLSSNRKAINWKTIGAGLSAQALLAIAVLKIEFAQNAFEFVGKIFVKILEFTQAGSEFLLGSMMDVSSFGFIFIFQILPTIIFFSALTSVLFYLGVIQIVVKGMAWVLTKLLGISGAESLSVAGNIFLGQTEAPLMIKAYLERMTRSEILLVMVGGMATVAGGVLAAYIGFLGGEDQALKIFYAKHLLTASVMAAPGAIVISKMLYPQQEKISSEMEVSQENIGSNILDAIANGTTEGLKLAANVGAMLLVFVAFIAMINYGFGKIGLIGGFNSWIAENTPYKMFSLEFILGYLFSPLMWIIGVAKQDMALMGQLLGIKLAASEFIGYMQLAELKDVTKPIHFHYEKSIIMATYMLCGFANFASIGIQIGGIGSLAPGKRKTLSEFGIRALIGGTIASLLSATIAGMIIG
ncbi:nucleoside transporter C-terminal domain-containing protein [Formosa algae]|uniref:CNT family concentrative nucleoside transporter n=1 Tax=Formosa algae TaxID=225843 RepID=A0A9X0YHH1_9FLAO|nr:nucleoside transporter C-terminal domain-containing protein [Formosa algae]MBP1838301.1 CNT family concentrative nucleoside transporter [Formosa algae]MDQ0334436.1 CNT family concentrative nucleoside transporter [Formosa algae]OEI82139.1 Na+ dependent nucleoside transporter [Formosa algae]